MKAQRIDIDMIEELKLRTWAREHYSAEQDRDASWHPIILDEMSRKDREVTKSQLGSPRKAADSAAISLQA